MTFWFYLYDFINIIAKSLESLITCWFKENLNEAWNFWFNFENIKKYYIVKRLPAGSVVESTPATQELWQMSVRSLGQEDPEEMTTHSIFLPGESHGQKSLMGHSLQGHKEWDMTEVTEQCCKKKKNRKLTCDTELLLTKVQILFKFHKILC